MESPGRFRLALTIVCALAAFVPPAANTARAATPFAPGPDSVRVHIEDGAGVDVTNEQFYEDAFVDTTFLGRKLVGTPEARVARLLSVALVGTRAQRATRYELRHELSFGNKIQGTSLDLAWRQELAPDWRLSFTPRIEYRHDRTFDRNLEETRASLGTQLRRTWGVSETAAEVGVLGELLRSGGEGESFLLDRNSARVSAGLDHSGLTGPDWGLEYRLNGRVFPDSSERDHVEHEWEARLHHTLAGGHAITFEAAGVRRQTTHVVATSRDNFWDLSGAGEGDLQLAEPWGLRLRADGEMFRYDVQDSVLFFDYQVARARLELRRGYAGSWLIAVGPRVERLTSELAPGEAYLEIGGALELDFAGPHSWWNLAPAAGWREYDAVPPSIAEAYPGLHSSYAFYEFTAFLDQPLPTSLRVRAVATVRAERHTDSAQDAISTYVSVQLRWTAF